MEVPLITLIQPSNDVERRYKQSRNIYMAVSSVNGPQILHHYKKLIDPNLFPTISRYMSGSTIDFGLVRDVSTVIDNGYNTNIKIDYSNGTTPSIFLPLTSSNGIRYRSKGIVYETGQYIEPGVIMLIPPDIDLLQFTSPMTGVLLVSNLKNTGRIDPTVR